MLTIDGAIFRLRNASYRDVALCRHIVPVFVTNWQSAGEQSKRRHTLNKFAIAIAAMTVLGTIGQVSAQTASTTTTTTTWNENQGEELGQAYTTNKYTAYNQPQFQASVGAELPSTVTFYPLPTTIIVPDRERYSYTVVNRHPVVVDRTTRRIVHTWN
jgi:hypothetical protein